MSKVAIRTMTVLGTVLAVIILFFVALSAGSLQVSTTQLLQGLYVSYDETVATIFDLRFPRVFSHFWAEQQRQPRVYCCKQPCVIP